MLVCFVLWVFCTLAIGNFDRVLGFFFVFCFWVNGYWFLVGAYCLNGFLIWVFEVVVVALVNSLNCFSGFEILVFEFEGVGVGIAVIWLRYES